MSDENKTDAEEAPEYSSVWDYGKSASLLDASKSDMDVARKNMIRFALQHNIRDIRTYSGYKGDLLLEITTLEDGLLPVLKAHAESLGMGTVIKEQLSTQIHELYCITANEEIYALKDPF